jgi:hypothetical protein
MAVFAVLLLSAMLTSVGAANLVDYDSGSAGRGNGHLPPWQVQGVDPDDGLTYIWKVSLNPTAPIGFGLLGPELDRLRNEFPAGAGWTFNLANNAVAFPGELRVMRCDPIVRRAGGGWIPNLDFEVDYYNSTPVPPQGHVLQWIQFCKTTHPTTARTGASGTAADVPYIDPYDYDWNIGGATSNGGYSDGTPFYWTDVGAPGALGGERAANTMGAPGMPAGADIRFTDRPWRYLVQAKVNAPVEWHGMLFLVDYDPATHTVLIDNYNGIWWGFTIYRFTAPPAIPGPVSYDAGGAGGDKYDGGEGHPINATMTTIGGFSFSVSVDKPSLLSHYVGLASTITAASVATALYVRLVRQKKRNNEHHSTSY